MLGRDPSAPPIAGRSRIPSVKEKGTNLEKEMATHSSILAWKNPWTEESGGLKSMGLHD